MGLSQMLNDAHVGQQKVSVRVEVIDQSQKKFVDDEHIIKNLNIEREKHLLLSYNLPKMC